MAAIGAALSMGFAFTACDVDQDPDTFLEDVKVNKSYVAIPSVGGSVSIDIDAKDEWTLNFDCSVKRDSLDDIYGVVNYYETVGQLELEENSWFTVNQVEGAAGHATLTFTASEATKDHTSNIRIKVGDSYQNLIVSQSMGAVEIKLMTVKEVIEQGAGNVRVKGYCKSIVNTSYGNWYMVDSEGNELYIYGTVDASGAYNWSSFNIAVGDEVVVEGPYVLYNGVTPEINTGSFVSVTKALLTSNDVSKTVGKESEPFTIAMKQKGQGLTFDSEVDWLKIAGGYSVDAEGNFVFTITPEENTTGVLRTGSLKFVSTKGKNQTILSIPVTQLGTDAVDTDLAAISASLKTSSNKNAQVFFDANLKDITVVYKNGSNYFLRDADQNSLLVYNGNLTLSVGQVLTGRIYGEGYAYNNLPEATSWNYELANVTVANSTPEPIEITTKQLFENYEKYINSYVVITDAVLGEEINVTFSKVTSKGKIVSGEESIALNHQSTGKYGKNKIFYYAKVAADSKIKLTCIPSVNKDTKQLNIYEAAWIEAVTE